MRKILSIFIYFLGTGILSAEETYQLTEKYSLNQPITHEMKIDFTLNLTKSSQGVQEPLNLSNQTLEKFTETFTQLDPAGFPIRAQRNYHLAQSTQNSQQLNAGYSGKTVFLQKLGDQTQVSSPGLTLSPEEIGTLQNELPDEKTQALFPPRPVKVGDTWIANEKAIVKLLGLDKSTRGTLKGRLVSVGPYANQPCALMEVNLVATTNQGGMDLSLDLTGKLYFSLNQNRLIAIEFQGPVTASGQNNSDKGPVEIQGQGQMQGYSKEV